MTCPHPSRRGALCVLAVCAFSLVWPSVVVAAPLPRLAVQRAPSAADCPDAPSLAIAVERVMERRGLDPVSTSGAPTGAGVPPGDGRTGAPRRCPVTRPRSPGDTGKGCAPPGDAPRSARNAGGAPRARTGLAELEVRFRDGATHTAVLQAGGRTRQLSSEVGASCVELVEAVALTIAILLDSDPPAPASCRACARAGPALSWQRRRPARRLRAPRPPPRAARGDVSRELARRRPWACSILPGGRDGRCPLRRRACPQASARCGCFRRTPSSRRASSPWGLAAATARGCATIAGGLDGLRPSACAAAVLGAVYGSGRGSPRTARPPRPGSPSAARPSRKEPPRLQRAGLVRARDAPSRRSRGRASRSSAARAARPARP